MQNPEHDVLALREITAGSIALVGGKAAHLAELSRIEGVDVPDGFCVTTRAFDRIAKAATIDVLLDRPIDAERIRQRIEAVTIPSDLAASITRAIGDGAYAVRSSATAEDLPTASFAGQQDSYLDIVGADAILEHVRRCWASLFTDRAVAYRERNGFDHRRVRMAVVVQRMVSAKASGVMFTADPVRGHRKVTAIEAIFGLGEALVSGRARPDIFKIQSGAILTRVVASEPALSDAQALRLAELGRRIEAHFGSPQDIEWCLDDTLHFVQSRPITTLFPIPKRSDDENHVYLSVGHQQMMTDAMKPLGISFWQLVAAGPMHEAGGRMFVDVTQGLASPVSRAGLLDLFRKADPLTAGAIQSIVDRPNFLPIASAPPPGGAARFTTDSSIEADPALVKELIARTEAALDTLKRDIAGKTGIELLDFIRADVGETKRILHDPQSSQVVLAAMRATWWLNEHLQRWLGEKNAADTLAQSVPHNVTSEMGLALLDVADAIRPHPEVVTFLESAGEDFMAHLSAHAGGVDARAAIDAWLEKYGARCPGEIDITRPRFWERPAMLVPAILRNVRSFAPGEAARRFENGKKEAEKKEREILERLRALADGEQKAAEARPMIDRVRAFMGYREYPKYGKVCRTFVYKRALLEEAERLVRANVLRASDDIFYFSLAELRDVVRAGFADEALVRERRAAFASYATLTPPRVLTSDGEILTGAYARDGVPPGALVGLGVSAGIVEGRARVVRDLANADLEAGDILVTTFTDPSWTPLFVSITGLVTEVGGQMTHGAVIAREYGLPAVVAVEDATKRIRDGQRIRVDGTEGIIELLS